jgi:hypothetical protein
LKRNGFSFGKLGGNRPGGNRLFRRNREPHPVDERQQDFIGVGAPNQRVDSGQAQMNWLDLLGRFDITEAFKTKGDLRRWSAKRTIGGIIALTACNDIAANGIEWTSVALCAVAVLPLCLSFMD